MQGAGSAPNEDQAHHQEPRQTFSAESGHTITLPGNDYVTNAEMVRDGADLVLRAPDGSEVVIQGYFNADPAPILTSPEGASLTPALVHSFAHDAGAVQYAAADQNASDASPVGRIEEIHGQATVTHPDGTKEVLSEGSPIHQGDIVETGADGAVNIVFIDETSFAVSKNAKLAIDQYVYDPSTENGQTNFSVLRGLFVYTSGLVGRDDPDSVQIETPRGSIGIRGTIIAGDADAGTVTVVEGAIVVHSLTGQEVTLSNQFETAQLALHGGGVESLGVRSSGDVSSQFGSLSGVLPTFFNTLDHSDANVPSANGGNGDNQGQQDGTQQQQPSDAVDGKPATDGTGPETMLQQQPGTLQPAPEGPVLALPPVPPPTFLQGMAFIPVYVPPPPPGDALTGTALPPPPTGSVLVTTSSVLLSDTTTTTTTSTTTTTTTTNSTTSGTSGSSGTALIPLALEVQKGMIPDDLVSGSVIGAVKTSVTFSSVAFTLATNGPFQLVYTAPDRVVIVYTGGGTLTDGDIYNFSITARLPDGRQVTQGFSQTVVPPLDEALDIGMAGAADGVHLIASSNGAGVSVAGIGDTDHDGLKEVGFIDYSGGTGQVQILEWSGTSFYGLTNIVTGVGGSAPDIYEDMVLSSLGDVNGDGKDDYAVGSPASDPGSASYAGDLTIFSGANPGTSPVTLNAVSSYVDGGERYGTGLAGVGDVNNDGIADVLISAPYEDGGSTLSGAAWLMFGNPNFFAGGSFDPSNVAPGLQISGVSSADRLGESVSSAGDFNHDGINDFIIGAPGVNGKGAAYILFGQDGTSWSGYNLSTAGNYLKITGTSLATGSELGGFVSSIGDFNGDGKSDVVIAETEDGTGGAGKIHVLFGGAGAGTIDVSTLNGTNGFTIDGNGSGLDIVGGGSVGDFNGDGRDDFAVIFSDGAGTNDIYVVYGRAGLPATLTLNDLENPSIAFSLIWDGLDGESIEITAAGDITGDGRDDFLIGSDQASSGSGAVYLVEGRESVAGPVTQHLGAAGTLVATAAGQSLVGTSGVDTLDAGLQSNVSMRAGAGNDTLLIGNGGLRLADGGAGIDILGLVTNAMTLDFSKTGAAQISEIERIKFQGVGQTLRLGIEDVFQLLHDSADGTLRIANGAGASGSTLQIDSNDSGSGTLSTALSALGFTGPSSGSYGDAGVTYNAYTNGAYTLLVDQTITNANVL